MAAHDDPHFPTAAVITVSYGSGEALDTFLSTLRTEHGTEVPVMVVDNKPGPDGVANLAAAHGCRYLPLPENPGYGAGMNAGVRALSRAGVEVDFFFFCNPDVAFISPAVPLLATALTSNPEAGSIGPLTLDEQGKIYPSARNIPSVSTGIGHALFGRVWPGNPWTRAYQNSADYGERRQAGWLSGAAVMVRRDVYERIGGWDEGYFLHFEDVDLGYRIGLACYTNVFEPTVTVLHTGGHSLKLHSAVAERAMTESAIRFMRKRYGGFWRSPVRWAVVAGLRARGVLKQRSATR